MTEYLKSGPFSSRPATKAYTEGWDRIFGKKKENACEYCGGTGDLHEADNFVSPCPACKGTGSHVESESR